MLSCQNTPPPADGIISRGDATLSSKNKHATDPPNERAGVGFEGHTWGIIHAPGF